MPAWRHCGPLPPSDRVPLSSCDAITSVCSCMPSCAGRSATRAPPQSSREHCDVTPDASRIATTSPAPETMSSAASSLLRRRGIDHPQHHQSTTIASGTQGAFARCEARRTRMHERCPHDAGTRRDADPGCGARRDITVVRLAASCQHPRPSSDGLTLQQMPRRSGVGGMLRRAGCGGRIEVAMCKG